MMKVKKLKKRIFSTGLACLTAASMLPVTAMATTADTSKIRYVDNGSGSKIEVTDEFAADGETKNLYHIDIIVLGTFEYEYEKTTTYNRPLVTVIKEWKDGKSHEDETVYVYLKNEDEDYIYDDDGEKATIQLTYSNSWEYTFEDGDYDNKVYYVEEAYVLDGSGNDVTKNYVVSDIDYDLDVTDDEVESGTIEGTITVTKINSVEYTYVDGSETKTQTIDSEYYYQTSDVGRKDQEFFCGLENDSNAAEVVRRLGTTSTDYNGPYGQLTTDSKITINLTYNYTYTNKDGEEVTVKDIIDDFTFNANEQNACSYVINYMKYGYYSGTDGTDTLANDYTLAGYDALITSEYFRKSVIENAYDLVATITNTSSGSSGGDGGEEETDPDPEPEDEEEKETPEEPDDGDDDTTDTTDTTPTVTEETTETTTTATASACLAIIKEDAETGAYLEGAVYALYSAYDDSLIGYYKTNEEGWLSTYPMSSGTYYFIETQAPEGYVLDETPVYVTLDASSGETLVTIVTNTAEEGEVLSEAVEPTEPDEPDDPDDGVVLGESRGAGTGDDSNLLLWLILMLAAGAGIGGVVLTTRRNHA